MPIDIVCGRCSKRYKVDGRLGGKKVRCKACDNDIAVPVFETLDDAPSAAEFQPVAAAVVGAPPPAQTVARDAGAPAGAARSGDEVSQRILLRHAVRRNARGYRVTRPYENAFLNFFEGAVVVTSQILYWLSVTALAVESIWLLIQFGKAVGRGLDIPFKAWAIVVLMTPVYFGATYFIILPIMAAGVRISSNLMKFEVPEDPDWRALAAYQISWLVGLILFFLVVTGTEAAAGGRNGPVRGEAFLVGIFLFILIIVPVHFFLTKIFFRLHFMETVIAYVFQFMVMLTLNAVSLALMLAYRFLFA